MKRIIIFIFSGIIVALSVGCNPFQEKDERKVVVRVNDSYLYQEDLKELISSSTTSEDSAVIVSNYITRWATQQLLIDRARLNLPEEKQAEFNDLVENYRNELYTTAYTDALVAKNLDTVFKEDQIEQYYENHKENFKLKEELVKLRFINHSRDIKQQRQIRKWFEQFDQEGKQELDKISLQFKHYSFNDSVWVRSKSVYGRIPPLKKEDRSRLLKKENFLKLEDSLNVYLIYVNDVLLKNQQAPLEYAAGTIEQILRNRRKLELTKELEKEITKDAIKNKQFEIYD